MTKLWLDATMLTLQSSQVVYLRLLKLTLGGSAAYAESELMVREKIAAGTAAGLVILGGGSVETVIAGYRAVVDANAERLLP